MSNNNIKGEWWYKRWITWMMIYMINDIKDHDINEWGILWIDEYKTNMYNISGLSLLQD